MTTYPTWNIALIDAYIIKKLLTQIPDSVDDALINGYIIPIQEDVLFDLLGDELYYQILLEQSGNTLSVANKYIYERYILYILSFRIMAKVFYELIWQTENGGIRKKISDQSESVDREELKDKVQIYTNFGDMYSKNMVEYINTNYSNYPLFYNSTFCLCGQEHNRSRQMNSGLNISGF